MIKQWKIMAKTVDMSGTRATIETVIDAKDAAEAWMRFKDTFDVELLWRYISVTEVKRNE